MATFIKIESVLEIYSTKRAQSLVSTATKETLLDLSTPRYNSFMKADFWNLVHRIPALVHKTEFVNQVITKATQFKISIVYGVKNYSQNSKNH